MKIPCTFKHFNYATCMNDYCEHDGACNGTGQIDIPLMETCRVCRGRHNAPKGTFTVDNCPYCCGGVTLTETGIEILQAIKPDIKKMVEMMLNRPRTLMKTCPECKGKKVDLFLACPTCHGTGKVPTEAGREILELVNMFKERGEK